MKTSLSPARLERALRAMRGRRVAVFGDAMLDEFLWGDATRISPEAPVPVVLLERQTWSLGGAGNVAANIAALGGHPILFSVLGGDAAGTRMAELVAEAGIEAGGLPQVRGRTTTVKCRVFARSKHLLRFDREDPAPVSDQFIRGLLAALEAAPDIEAVAVADYAKGCVTPALVRGIARYCTARRLPWCVDPKGTSLRYRGATVVKPNLNELEALTAMPARSLDALRRAAAQALRTQRCQYLLVTRGQHGIALFGADGSEALLDGPQRSVSDVTGAGDTVNATVSLGLAAALPMATVASVANLAAGFVVTQPGVAVAHAGDLMAP